MSRRRFVCGNWKLHYGVLETTQVIDQIIRGLDDLKHVDVVVAPVMTTLFAACNQAKKSNLQIAAQNVFFEPKGAFTGEVSVAHLRELGCQYAIVGHSERRRYFAETNEIVAKKVKACLEGSIAPIACIGETLQEREQGRMHEVLTSQLEAIFSVVEHATLPYVIIAYEPVWAIGTGKNATSAGAQEVHAFVRGLLVDQFGHVANQVRILYGGSVNPENAAGLMDEPDIDGVLVGGASLKPDSFLAIAHA